MKERGCDPNYVISYLKASRTVQLTRGVGGYEVLLPSKGRLIGVLEGDRYVAKTFLTPIRGRREQVFRTGKNVDETNTWLLNKIIVSNDKKRAFYSSLNRTL